MNAFIQAKKAESQQQVREKLKALLCDLQLHNKLCKSDQFLKMDFPTRTLLQEQQRVMSRYAQILEERISLF